MYAIRNGQLIEEKEAVVPITQREVFFNFSVYESLKVLEGAALFADDHVERFMDSAKILGMTHSYRRQELLGYINLLIEKNKSDEATLKIHMIGGTTPLLFLFLSPLPTYQTEWYNAGVSVISYRGERIFPRAKSNCLLLNYIASREAAAAGALDALLVNRKGEVTEGTRSNFYAFEGDTLITAEDDILFGVTRKLVLKAAQKEDITVKFKMITLDDLLEGRYEEPFISSTSMGAMPIRQIDGKRTGSQFPRVRSIHQAVKGFESEELKRIKSLLK
jgi:D-alanine transaminase/branched-chain amino acid aminotransferase